MARYDERRFLTSHKAGVLSFSRLRRRVAAFARCTCGVGFNRWADTEAEAEAKAREALVDHLAAHR